LSCNVLQMLHINLQKISILILVLNECVEKSVHNGFMKQQSLYNAFQPGVIWLLPQVFLKEWKTF
jgi:hypothetical protein